MITRPVALIIAVALVNLMGAGLVVIGALLLAVGAGAIPFLAQSSTSSIVAVLGAIAIIISALTFAAAAGLWRNRTWGWMGSLLVGIGAVVGAIVAFDASGPQSPTVIGLVLALASVGLLLAPSTRGAAGISSRP